MGTELQEKEDRNNRRLINQALEELPAYVGDFVTSLVGATATSTQMGYVNDMRHFYNFLSVHYADGENPVNIPLETITALTVDDINKYKAYLIDGDEETGREPCTPFTVKRKLSSLSAFYQYLMTTEKIERNPVVLIRRPKLPRKSIVHIPDQDIEKLLKGIESCELWYRRDPHDRKKYSVVHTDETYRKNHAKFVLRDIAMIIVFLGTGLRCSELASLNKDDVRMEEDPPYLRVWRQKGQEEAKIYFGSDVYKALDDYLNLIPAEIYEKYNYRDISRYMDYIRTLQEANAINIPDQCARGFGIETEDFKRDMAYLERNLRFSGREGLRSSKHLGEQALFLSKNGTRLQNWSIWDIVKSAVKCYLPNSPDIDNISPHTFRKTFATKALAETGEISTVQTILGHRNIGTTAAYYAQVQDDAVRKALTNHRVGLD